MKKRLVLAITVIVVTLVCVLGACSMNKEESLSMLDDSATVMIEVLDEENDCITSYELEAEDEELMRNTLLSGREVADNGFVFAEGKYRVILENTRARVEL